MQRRVPELHCVGYGVIYCDILRCAAAAKLKMDHGALLSTLWGTDYKEEGRWLVDQNCRLL